MLWLSSGFGLGRACWGYSGLAGASLVSACVEEKEGDEGHGDKQERGAVGGGVREVLDLIVEGDGEGAGGARDVSADHEDDAEFTDGVGKAEGRGGDEGVGGEWEQDAGEDAERAGSEELGLFDEGWLDGAKSCGEGLDGEGETVEDGADDEAGEGEGDGVAEEAGGVASKAGCGAEEDEEVEAEDGGRKQEREGGRGFDEGTPARAGGDDPPGDGYACQEQDERGGGGETEGEPEGLQVH
jgi:hypothetical protein